MAPALPNSKRKRGGPVRPPVVDGDVGDATRRAARKRTASERDQLHGENMNDEDAGNDANPRPSKRGRPREDHDGATNTPVTNTRIAQNSRRRAQDKESQDDEQEGEESTRHSGSLRRSTRDRRSADAQPWWVSGVGDDSALAEQGEAETPSVGLKKRGQRPGQGSAPSTQPPASELPRRKQGGRGSKAAAEESIPELEVEPKDRGRKRTSGVGEASGRTSLAKTSKRQQPPPVTEAADERRVSIPKARRRSKPDGSSDAGPVAEDEDMENSQGAPPAKYRHLVPRTRQIPRSTISAKWTPLEEASVGAVSALISDTSRPVLLRLQGREQRHQQAHNALRAFASRLHSKLRKGIPFPPPSAKAAPTRNSRSDGADSGASHMDEFDFERTVNSIQALEATLNPLLHSVSLLKSERDREEGALEKDYEALRTLEANARAEVRGWKERGRRAHALAPGVGRVNDVPKGAAEAKLEVLKSGRRPAAGIFKGIEDEEIKTLSRRLGSHVESIRGNLQPIAELLPTIAKSRAALQGVLHNHLGAQQYDKAFVD